MSATPAPAASSSHPTTSTEYQIPSPPTHPVSAIAFHPYSTGGSSSSLKRQVLVSSWDNTVRLYQLPDADGSDGQQKAQAVKELHSFKHEAPVLDVCWINDTLAASGGIDRRVRILNLSTGQASIIGKHASAISRVRYEPSTNLLLTASWDRALQLWDPLGDQPRHLKTLPQPDKVLAMDVSPPFPSSPLVKPDTKKRLVVAMTGRQVRIYDLEELRRKVDAPQQDGSADDEEWEAEQNRESSLKYMIRDLRCSPDGIGYTSSSVEGRVAVDFFDKAAESQAKKYAFKCHRVAVDGVDTVYPVNAIGYNPIHGTFFSLGGDANFYFWDPYLKKRIRALAQYPTPLTTAGFSSDGSAVIIASGGENIEEKPSVEDARQAGPNVSADQLNGEVGGLQKGGEGKVVLWVRERAGDESKPKAPKA